MGNDSQIKITTISAQETWEIRHRVMWPDKSVDFVKLPEDEQGIHFGLWQMEKMVAVVSLFTSNGEVQFRKLAAETAYQNKGFGTLLLSHVMDYVSDRDTSKVWCNARVDKTEFYKRFGMLETNEKFSKGDIDFVIMEKHLKTI